MKISDILMLMGGLSLFLYGMDMMSKGLEAAAGNRLKSILEKLTSNRFKGVLVGALITAIIQSSSATTVMTVGFVNSGIMNLTQAVGVIMGANIGTTVTGQLIALDIGTIAYLLSFVGVLATVFLKEKTLNHIGQIVAGLGILFIGMNIMGSSMIPLRESQSFISLMTRFTNPLLGILAGAVFTGIIQSSSASVGILQALAGNGLIGLNSSVYVLFGQNIGTCVTAVLASLGANKNAKRVAIIHLLFNCIGTAVFVCICMATPFTEFIISLTPYNSAAQIANAHTVFNIVTTLLLFPFGNYLAKLATKILPGEDKGHFEMQTKYIKGNVGSSAITVTQFIKETKDMYAVSTENFKTALNGVMSKNKPDTENINKNEKYINYLNTEIVRGLTHTTFVGINEYHSKVINAMYRVTSDVERIGDHAINILEYHEIIRDRGLVFSDTAMAELRNLSETLYNIIDIVNTFDYEADNEQKLDMVSELEEKIDDMTKEYRYNQIDRMKISKCSPESGVLYSEFLTDVERVSDHLLNIAQAMSFK